VTTVSPSQETKRQKEAEKIAWADIEEARIESLPNFGRSLPTVRVALALRNRETRYIRLLGVPALDIYRHLVYGARRS